MRREFYEIYERLFEEYYPERAFLFSHRYFDLLSRRQVVNLIADTRQAIEDASRELEGPIRLRPDAKYFLMLNFLEMVLLPITIAKEISGDTQSSEGVLVHHTREQIREDLNRDIRLIIGEAARRQSESFDAQERGEEEFEISGHGILDAVRDTWDKIKFNEYLYWASS